MEFTDIPSLLKLTTVINGYMYSGESGVFTPGGTAFSPLMSYYGGGVGSCEECVEFTFLDNAVSLEVLSAASNGGLGNCVGQTFVFNIDRGAAEPLEG